MPRGNQRTSSKPNKVKYLKARAPTDKQLEDVELLIESYDFLMKKVAELYVVHHTNKLEAYDHKDPKATSNFRAIQATAFKYIDIVFEQWEKLSDELRARLIEFHEVPNRWTYRLLTCAYSRFYFFDKDSALTKSQSKYVDDYNEYVTMRELLVVLKERGRSQFYCDDDEGVVLTWAQDEPPSQLLGVDSHGRLGSEVEAGESQHEEDEEDEEDDLVDVEDIAPGGDWDSEDGDEDEDNLEGAVEDAGTLDACW